MSDSDQTREPGSDLADWGCGIALFLVFVALGAGLAWRVFKWASGEFA